jgi:hypothetical protein
MVNSRVQNEPTRNARWIHRSTVTSKEAKDKKLSESERALVILRATRCASSCWRDCTHLWL